jgi:hypothetical protein
MDDHAFHQILWKAEGFESLERCTLKANAAGWELDGTVVCLVNSPTEVRYHIRISESWETQLAIVSCANGPIVSRLTLIRNAQGAWQIDDLPRSDLDGCFDIDLGITPSTNTLPIRRLNLAVGEKASVDAAWVQFPSLEVARLPQTYTRIDDSTYHYQSATGFETYLQVNDAGLTTNYDGGWQEITLP